MANIPFTCGRDCPNREPGCHGKCEKYQREKAEYNKLKAAEEARTILKYYTAETYSKSLNDLAKRHKNNRGYFGYHK